MAIDLPASDCWFLSGPTAAGKSRVGLELAAELGAEIISLDSMALYRGMDIGTAKPSAADRAEVPHHLIDVIEPDKDYSLARYKEAAETCVADIRARGREPLFVGGTPLYLKALLRGIFRGPEADWDFRRCLESEARLRGGDWLHQRLTEVDPAAAARLHPRDTRRLIRALEVYEKTGRPISEQQRQFERARPAEACRVFVLDWPRKRLYDRIDARVEQMFAGGLLDEVRRLVARPGGLGKTARQALAYREAVDHLAGRRDLAATIELVQQRTRQFAKRQLTWFRSLSEVRWTPVAETDSPAELAGRIAAIGRGKCRSAGL